MREYRRKHRARIVEQVREWRRKNPERAKEHARNNYHRNKHKGYWVSEKKRDRDRQWQKENREAIYLARKMLIGVKEARRILDELDRKKMRDAARKNVSAYSLHKEML